jgi:plastocyanin
MRVRALSLIGSVMLVAGCGGGGDSGQGPGGLSVAKTASASGDAQSGVVGTALASPLRVVVTSDGAPQTGTTVVWSAAGGGSIAPASAVTDGSGIATGTWTLGHTAGTQAANATVTGASGSPVAFSAAATAGAAAAMAIHAGNNQTGAAGSSFATPLQVLITDQFGNAVAGVAVTWAVASGGGSVTPTSSVSNSQGVASTTQTLPATAGTVTVTATAAGLSGSPATFTSTATQSASGTTVMVVNNQFQPASLPIAAGTTVSFVWGTGAVGHNIVPEPPATIPTDPTVVSAPHTYMVTFNTPGTYRYYCSQHGDAGTGGIPTGMSGSIVVQ